MLEDTPPTKKSKVIKGFLIGQILSVINATTYAMTNYLGQTTMTGSAIFQAISVYWALPIPLFILSLFYSTEAIVDFLRSVKVKIALSITLIDITATVCMIIGIQKTTVVSSELISVCGIPFVIILSYFILHKTFSISQLFSAGFAVLGFILVSIGDVQKSSTQLVGDVLCLVSTILYSVSNTLQELTINMESPFSCMNYIILLGMYGPFLSLPFALLFFVFPINFNLSPTQIAVFATYPFLQVVIYSSIALVIKTTSAAFFNVSNLTSSIYGLFYDLFLFNVKPNALAIVGAVFIFISVFLFSFFECR
ncbi:hypothetical protein EIN_025640 [Entamoeba invadens IP1]|uniref:hypothetical protein n=1 Tax=Entamoeba invadens IP1 TaxID=370355 RepID=UPI0002C3D230|nr:hypothetical protein EIN_025640 [Entamoeba invadens IP1]ELP90735.1 hypothetical protein EIN_025640 [Entamoeba invadens IP1]|eukprot:XP_004257506.1 hypothetical protein EIN_025640 [Entamoeba invadens IP1]